MEQTETKTSEPVTVQVKKGPEMTQAPQQSQPVSSQTSNKKGGIGCFGKFMIFGCLLLLLCCCITTITAIVAPKLLIQYVAGGNKGPDTTLTRITASEVEPLIAEYESSIPTISEDGLYVLTMSEEEVLALLVDAMKLSSNADSVGVNIESAYMKFEVDLGELLTIMNEGSEQPQDFSAFKGTYISIELTNTLDGNISFQSISLGNSVLDPIINSLLTDEAKENLSQQLQDSFSGQSSDPEAPDSGLRKIIFIEDAVELYLEVPEEGLEIPDDEMYLYEDYEY